MITAATSVSLCVLCGTLPTSARIARKTYGVEHNNMNRTIAIFVFAVAVTSTVISEDLPAAMFVRPTIGVKVLGQPR